MKSIPKTQIVIYAIIIAALVVGLRMLNYFYVVRHLRIEFYLGVVALGFAVVGVWVGLRLTKKPELADVVVNSSFSAHPKTIEAVGLSKRELEVLQLMSAGMSNQEIADKLFVSLNTVKTHSANLFLKLDVKRRTQAVHRAKELGLIG